MYVSGHSRVFCTIGIHCKLCFNVLDLHITLVVYELAGLCLCPFILPIAILPLPFKIIC